MTPLDKSRQEYESAQKSLIVAIKSECDAIAKRIFIEYPALNSFGWQQDTCEGYHGFPRNTDDIILNGWDAYNCQRKKEPSFLEIDQDLSSKIADRIQDEFADIIEDELAMAYGYDNANVRFYRSI